MRISDWSSDVCSSDLLRQEQRAVVQPPLWKPRLQLLWPELLTGGAGPPAGPHAFDSPQNCCAATGLPSSSISGWRQLRAAQKRAEFWMGRRSEEHTSELQSLMRISNAGICLKKKNH